MFLGKNNLAAIELNITLIEKEKRLSCLIWKYIN